MKRLFADHLLSTAEVDHRALDALGDLDWNSREPIGRLALLHGLLHPSSIDEILARQQGGSELFGQLAVDMGLLTPSALWTLLVGQAARSCVELAEDLALNGVLPIERGLVAMNRFLVRDGFLANIRERQGSA